MYICRYLIPFRMDNTGPCYASVLKKYFQAVDDSLPVRDNSTVFFTGLKRSAKGGPKFMDCSIGKNTLSDVGKMVAAWLKLPTPERYTGHCFR